MSRKFWRELGRAITRTGPGYQPEPLPRRGDQFEQWLKARRDEHGWHGTNDRVRYETLDRTLDQYRLHADTGTPLDQHACEGGTVDDCHGCYEVAKGEQR